MSALTLPRFAAACAVAAFLTTAHAEPSVTKIVKDDKGNFTLLYNGKPYIIKGAGGSHFLAELVKYGGNSIRTWGIESLDESVDGKPLIKRAEELGISVAAGIWIKGERQGVSYKDQKFLEAQREEVRAAVRKYKDEPALLIWSLGNEAEGVIGPGDNPDVWKEFNVLADIVHKEDPNHPVMTVIAGAAPTKIKAAMQYYPNIDILGVNAYASAPGVGKALREAGWAKPFVLTEFGPVGHWEVAKAPWGAPVEPSSKDKAANYFVTQKTVGEKGAGLYLGSYCFLWGQKQEVTSTWYGMFLKSGEKLPTVDAMNKAWTGAWPANRSPRIEALESTIRETNVAPGTTVTATVTTKDFENDPVQIEWEVVPESTDLKIGGDAESEPPPVKDAIVSQKDGEVTIRTPDKSGPYRLFVTVRDGKGGASKDNFPFLVK
ncbi:MAG: glycoside hydrolase family 2 TIM barrel-domain containing protein [Chthoniobacterales bacterium]